LFSQRAVGYVDDFSGVYDLGRNEVGSADVIARGDEHIVRSASGRVAGFVGSKSESVNGGSWHKVYDAAHALVGLVDNGSEIVGPDGQTIGSVNYNEGNGGTGWLRAGAALLLLIRRPAP
jgi:hypothetical protein